MTVVYLDSVFLFNALLDYLLFLSTARLAGIPLRRRRYLLCGVLGGLYAVTISQVSPSSRSYSPRFNSR